MTGLCINWDYNLNWLIWCINRLLFGTSQLFVFKNPFDRNLEKSTVNVTFELAQEEIASKSYNFNNEDQSIEQAILNKELLELIPAVEEANAISEELEKMVRFDIILVSPLFLGKIGRKPEVSLLLFNNWIASFFFCFLAICESYQLKHWSRIWMVKR